jgi:hypothetical protein
MLLSTFGGAPGNRASGHKVVTRPHSLAETVVLAAARPEVPTRGVNMTESNSAPRPRPAVHRPILADESRSIEWLQVVEPIIFDPYVPGDSDLPTTSSSVDQVASPGDSGDSGQADAQSAAGPETKS